MRLEGYEGQKGGRAGGRVEADGAGQRTEQRGGPTAGGGAKGGPAAAGTADGGRRRVAGQAGGGWPTAGGSGKGRVAGQADVGGC